jgi:hypothetical protein
VADRLEPFRRGLKKQTLRRVRAEASAVTVRLELASLRDPSGVLDIEIVLAPEIAAQLGWELLESVKKF